jgi:2-oxoglutarate dehydrogenase E2 component (dihydrolipoamide succinyltransferase)
MASPVTMPQLGETVVEGTITRWLKKEGEHVDRDEPLFEISTDKVDTEVPSPLAGTITAIKVQEGETVKVGTELATIDTGDGQVAEAPAEEPAEAPSAEAAPSEAAQEQAAQPAPAAEAPQAEQPSPVPPTPEPAPSPVPPEPVPSPVPGPGPVPAPPGPEPSPTPSVVAGGPMAGVLSPLVRRLAEERGVDLAQVPGTGTGGRITKRDVLAYAESGGAQAAPAAASPVAAAPAPAAAPAAAAPPAVAPVVPLPTATPAPEAAQAGAREEVIPLTRMRQAIARHMVGSLQTSARAWNMVEVNMENVVRTRETAKESFREREGINLTFMPFVARAVCDALAAYPDVNSELREDHLVRKHYVNLGIAVALDEGLIVPVIKGADSMNLVGLGRAIQDIATRARSKKLLPDDVQGSTFTITNPGPFGSVMSVPIINQPNCAILAFDTIEKRPVVVDDAIAIRHMVYLSMSWDHRIIDGATAAKFLARLRENLETWDFGPEVGLPARG